MLIMFFSRAVNDITHTAHTSVMTNDENNRTNMYICEFEVEAVNQNNTITIATTRPNVLNTLITFPW